MRLGTPRPNNGGARTGTGPLRKRVQLKPFAAEKGETISVVDVCIFRCNLCGAIGLGNYTEVVQNKEYHDSGYINHAAQPLQHKPGCPVGG